MMAKPLFGSEVQISKMRSGAFQIIEGREFEDKLDRSETLERFWDITYTLHGDADEDVEFLAGLGLPNCLGFEWDESGHRNQMRLLYSTSSKVREITSLRALLLEKPKAPLNERLAFAQQLSRAVLYVHAYKYVHKIIRSSNILLCEYERENEDEVTEEEKKYKSFPYVLGRPFLVDFSDARLAVASYGSPLGEFPGPCTFRSRAHPKPDL